MVERLNGGVDEEGRHDGKRVAASGQPAGLAAISRRRETRAKMRAAKCNDQVAAAVDERAAVERRVKNVSL